jgi:hypothetical protein
MKKETSKTVKTAKNSNITPSNGLLVVVMVLVVMSGIQVVQTQQLLNAVSSGNVNVGAPSGGSSIGLPSQVGGC